MLQSLAPNPADLQVLCIGHACYDLIFSVPYHPHSDEKIFADGLLNSGGGPAANAAVGCAKLGLRTAFAGYLGNDFYGEQHFQELRRYGVNTDFIVRGPSPTPLSTVLVKPDGQRALINYKGETRPLPGDAIDFSGLKPKVVLFDGHEPQLSLALLEALRDTGIITILDAGSVHAGTLALMDKVDYLACSEKFAKQLAGDIEAALKQLSGLAPQVIITLGEHGLVWQRGPERGELPAISVNAVDSTGAGDAFHGALAAAVALNMDWLGSLRYAGAAGSFCCTRLGARQGLPDTDELTALLTATPLST